MKFQKWSWLKAVEVAKRHDVLEIDWRWRNEHKRRAARKARKKGCLKRLRGAPGADYYKFFKDPESTGDK